MWKRAENTLDTIELGGRTRRQAPESRQSFVYEEIRARIVNGALRPNQRIIELEIADDLGVSRTPVRESLQRLAGDGLVAHARSGWVVRELSRDEIGEIYEVRVALEGYAAFLAAQRADADQMSVIAGLAAEHLSAVDSGCSFEDRVGTNDAFHAAVFSASRNRRLVDQIYRNSTYYYNVRLASLYNADELKVSMHQHVELSDAIRRRDSRAAEEIARAHTGDALRVILDKI